MNSAKEVDNLLTKWKSQGLTKAEIIIKEADAMLGWPYAWGATGQDCTVANRKTMMNRSAIGEGDKELIRKRCQVLNGSKSSCTECTYYPNNERTRIQDCHGFIKELHKAVGITLSGAGCTSMWKADSNWSEKGEIKNMPMDKVCCVFKYISSTGKMDHIGEHIGGGDIIHCSGIVKHGSITEKGWTHYAIPKGMEGTVPVSKPTLRKGSSGEYVTLLQTKLIQLGYDLSPYGADGKYGNKTISAVKQFQRTHYGPDGKKLTVDGVTGQSTWWALDQAVGPQPVPVQLYTVTVPHLTNAEAEALIAQYPGATKAEENEK